MDQFPSNLLPDQASPDWMNKGDNAWQLTAATVVGLQSIPGLVILYGSVVKKKWAVNSAFMAFYAFAAVLFCWVAWGFRMSFGEKLIFFLGKPAVALDEKFLLGQAFLGYFPTATMVFFQGVFAGITLILIAGSLLGRMNIRAWMLFVPLWLTFSYTVAAFSIWCPDGWLAKLRVIDFSGGYVIHLSAGVAGFTAAYWVGPRSDLDKEMFPEANNMIMVLAGAGLLWMGWSGFNGGGPFSASTLASLAVLNTHVCAATSILTWIALDTFYLGRPSVFGAVQGMITGLVCITPGAGVVQGWAAIIMGVISGSIPWYTMMVLHNKLSILKQIDDPMAIFHTHAIAGALGAILTGFFAVPKLCRLFYDVQGIEYIGLAYALQNGTTRAGLRQMGIQMAAIVFVTCFNVVMTTFICLFVRTIVPLRLDEDALIIGDKAVHGEEAFALWASFHNFKPNKCYDAQDISSVVGSRSMRELQMV
ncbi:hypothetical protein L6164_035152 [Bauhinia variegata]|uniref:Uncharacterized protein n=1 Tax=Bauhinia variegata TaxID=167791 RepID=A0ACB9KWW6_BAUVA|nr:hypothetical protein L6164_035152 [Bauhinia variegata]